MKRFVGGIASCIFATVVFMFCAMGVVNADAKFTLTTTDGQTTFDFALSAFCRMHRLNRGINSRGGQLCLRNNPMTSFVLF